MNQDESDLRIVDAATGLPAEPVQLSKRANRRYEVHVQVGLQTEHNFYQGLSENLSEGGLFIATHQTMPIGTKIALNFALPSVEEPLKLEGEVRWVRDSSGSNMPGMGIRFVDLSEETTNLIKDFIRIREPEFYDD
jgi:uncharacterized protein (TIGR02266 family)